MSYVEQGSVLSGAIRWSVSDSGTHRVLPDGCIDLVMIAGRVVVAGPYDRTFLSRAAGECTGVRFAPGQAPGLLGVCASELRNLHVPLEDVVVDSSTRRVSTHLVTADSFPEASRWSSPAIAVHILDRLERGGSVSSTAASIGLGVRQFRRRCHDLFGYGPSTLRSVMRFQLAVSLLGDGTRQAAAAAEAGYADQPHMAREVRRLSGSAPSKFELSPTDQASAPSAPASGANRSMPFPSGSWTVE